MFSYLFYIKILSYIYENNYNFTTIPFHRLVQMITTDIAYEIWKERIHIILYIGFLLQQTTLEYLA